MKCKGRVDIINSTLGKALGGGAGITCILFHVIHAVIHVTDTKRSSELRETQVRFRYNLQFLSQNLYFALHVFFASSTPSPM